MYPLQEILLLVLCVVAGAEDFVEIERWGRLKLDLLRRLLPFARGVPSQDTLNDVMNALPAKLFSNCFVAWVETLREDATEIVAIDGKSSRRAHGWGGAPLHLVSAWASRQRLVLGQEAVAGNGAEITAIPRLLERLELTGALVTIDAIGCQREIAKAIRARAPTTCWSSRTTGRRWPKRSACSPIASRRPPSTSSRASTASMATSRPATPASAIRSAGS